MDLPGASSADKKRNKLGYHRTSVACVHCRRRKIRCLVAADDTQGRCENCIRLRKECHFYPVDQQPPTEKKARPGAQLEPSLDPTASSPPGLSSGSMDPADMYTYSLPMHSTPDMGGFHPAGFPANPMGPFTSNGIAQPDMMSAQTIDPSASWDASTGQRISPVMWTQGQVVSPIPTASPIAGMPGQPQMMAAGPSPYATVQPDGTIWPGPGPLQRSMTVPTQQDLGSPFPSPGPFSQNMPPELKRRMTSPAQTIGGIATPSPMQSPSPGNLQVPVSYTGQPMTYRQWNGMSAMPMEGGGYAMFSPGQVPSNFPMNQNPSSGP